MPTERTYRCLSCLDNTVNREFNVSHLSKTCDSCGEFGRFIQEAVYEQFEDFESSPPANFAWDKLDRMEKFVVAERLVRSTKSLSDFDVESPTSE